MTGVRGEGGMAGRECVCEEKGGREADTGVRLQARLEIIVFNRLFK